MSTPKKITVNVDQIKFLLPSVAGNILNAFYCALLLKKQSGIEITKAIEDDVLNEIVSRWNDIYVRLDSEVQKES